MSKLENQPTFRKSTVGHYLFSPRSLGADEARLLADRLPTRREEFGGFAWNAATSSFLLFASGALFPVVPFFFLSGSAAVPASITISAVVLFLIDAGVTLFTGRDLFFSGIRQLLIELAAASVTYTLGHYHRYDIVKLRFHEELRAAVPDCPDIGAIVLCSLG
jgi:vacuolar iron transporter family protein